jgi:hypothetical protein
VRTAVLTIGCLIGALVLGVMLVPEGEVVTLSTLSPDGLEHETELWVVDGSELPGGGADGVYLRANSERARWLERLRTQPQVALLRGGAERAYVAQVVTGEVVRASVNHAMAAKYGVSDRLMSWVVDPSASVPVRLVPDPTRESAAREPTEAHVRPQ